MLAIVPIFTKTTCKGSNHIKLDLVCLIYSQEFYHLELFQSLHVYSFGNSCSSFLVIYGERYNDLEKYICSIKHDDVYFDHFHPCAALTTDHVSDTIFVLSNRNYLCISQSKSCLVDTFQNESVDTA